MVRSRSGIFFASSPQRYFEALVWRPLSFRAFPGFQPEHGQRELYDVREPVSDGGEQYGEPRVHDDFRHGRVAKTPNAQNWNLTVERELGGASAVEISYAASKGTHLPIYFNLNQPYWPQRVPADDYPGFGTINYYSFSVNSIHNAGTATFRRRFTHGFSTQQVTCIARRSTKVRRSRAVRSAASPHRRTFIASDATGGVRISDIPHAFTTTFSWVSPSHQVLLRGWQLAGSGRFYSGLPFTPSLAKATLGQPHVPDRLRKGTAPDPSVSRWFDITAFVPVPTNSFRFGNSRRSILDGPGHEELNLNVSKDFAVTEGSDLQFRREISNAMNHPNFGLPIKNIDVANAATLTTVGSGRLMQFALRYSF